MNVIKRDGTIQQWDFNKIVSAVTKAFRAVNQYPTEKFLEQLEMEFNSYIKRDNDLTVEEIHDIVRNLFIKKNQFEVVDGFIRWRREREEIRETKSELISEITKKINKQNKKEPEWVLFLSNQKTQTQNRIRFLHKFSSTNLPTDF